MSIYTWAVLVHRYGTRVIERRNDELKVLDTQKMMTVHGALHFNRDEDRVYRTCQKGERGLVHLRNV